MQWYWWMALPFGVSKTRRQLMHSLGGMLCIMVTESNAVSGELLVAAAEEEKEDEDDGVGGAMV